MKRARVVALGVLLLFAGLMLMPFSKAATVVTNYNLKEQGPEYSSWGISQNFNQSEILGFDFRPNSDWSGDTFDFYYSTDSNGTVRPYRFLEIEVTNPQSNHTKIRIMLIITPNTGATGVSVYPDYFEVYNSTSSDWVRLVPAEGFNDQPEGIVIEKGYPNNVKYKGWNIYQLGRTSIQGVYSVSLSLDPETVHVPGSNNSRASAPPYLVISEAWTETDYPYTWLLPVGIPTSVVGMAITILGVRSKKHKTFQRV